MKANFWKFVIPFVLFAILISELAASFPFNWGFCGVGLPTIFGGVCLISQLGTGAATTKDNEWVIAGFGAALGGAFALYIFPLFIVH